MVEHSSKILASEEKATTNTIDKTIRRGGGGGGDFKTKEFGLKFFFYSSREVQSFSVSATLNGMTTSVDSGEGLSLPRPPTFYVKVARVVCLTSGHPTR